MTCTRSLQAAAAERSLMAETTISRKTSEFNWLIVTTPIRALGAHRLVGTRSIRADGNLLKGQSNAQSFVL